MILEIVRIALSSLKANKLRSFLSILGIIIGVAAVIAIISIGFSAQQEVTSQIQGLGSDLIWVRPGFGVESRELRDKFSIELAYHAQKNSPDIINVVPARSGSGTLSRKGESYRATIVGTEKEFAPINIYNSVLGRFISETDSDRASNAVVLGAEISREIFGSSDPVGERITIAHGGRSLRFNIIGVMEEKGQGVTGDLDSQVYIPITTFNQRLAQNDSVDTYYAESGSEVPARQARHQLDYFFYQYLGSDDDYSIFSQDQILDVLDSVSGTLTLMLGGVAAISLLVGGIGIMNIMLVSVTERTHEIGIRKALGAKKRHILTQFLCEALSLTGLGGLIGIGLGLVATYIVADIGGWPMVISPAAVLLAFFFSLAIGVFFGLYPAVKAARLDPVDALSYE